MSTAETVRGSAALFRLEHRGLLEVRGGDRERWLESQISNALPPTGERGGCYAFVLTAAGRIVTDVHVLPRASSTWLETDRAALAPLRARLEKLLIADDVELVERSFEVGRLALEGPRAREVLAGAVGTAVDLEPDSAHPVRCAGHEILVAAYGWSGEEALQIFAPAEELGAVEGALARAGEPLGLGRGDEATLMDLLRVEAGIPRFGAELDEDVLPAETGLIERAVSFTKGCYVGQEVVARMHSRGRAAHHLVGIVWKAGVPPPVGAAVGIGDERVGEVTSSALSARVGAISLAYVKSPHHALGTAVVSGERAGRTVALPFVSAQPVRGESAAP